MQVGLLVALLLASVFYGFYWQSFPFGIAVGYGIYAVIELTAAQLRTTAGESGNVMFQLSKVLGYHLAVLIWIAFLARHRTQHALKDLPTESMKDWLPAPGRSLP
jgi:hypothetical protein